MSKSSLLQDQWIVRVVLILWIASSVLTLYLLTSMDQIVHHVLYAYGLQFSLTWASDYWGVYGAISICTIIPLILSTSLLALDLQRKMKRTNRTYRKESEKYMPVSCNHCKRRFQKALVMHDFQQKPPKLVNVCPYCNSVLGSIEGDSTTYHVAEHQKVTA